MGKTDFEEVHTGKVHVPPREFVRVQGVLVRTGDYRKAHPLSAAQIAQNRAGLLGLVKRSS